MTVILVDSWEWDQSLRHLDNFISIGNEKKKCYKVLHKIKKKSGKIKTTQLENGILGSQILSLISLKNSLPELSSDSFRPFPLQVDWETKHLNEFNWEGPHVVGPARTLSTELGPTADSKHDPVCHMSSKVGPRMSRRASRWQCHAWGSFQRSTPIWPLSLISSVFFILTQNLSSYKMDLLRKMVCSSRNSPYLVFYN